MISSPIDLAKKKKNVRIRPGKTPLGLMPNTKKMRRISYCYDPESESGGGLNEKPPAIVDPEPNLSDETPNEPISGESSVGAETCRSRTSASLCHGVVSVIGRRRVMEDAVAVVPGLEVGGFQNYADFFAVYDGYGSGAAPSMMCRNRMHLMVAMEAEKRTSSSGESSKGLDYWKKVMINSFRRMDEEIRSGYTPENDDEDDGNRAAAARAVVVMVSKEEVVVANRGNSRAVLYRGGVAMPLCSDIIDKVKPLTIQLETHSSSSSSRYIKSGKRHRHLKFVPIMKRIRRRPIIKQDDYRRVVPEVTVTERSEWDDFVVIGSDGMWDVISNEMACAVVGKCLNGGIRMKFADETSENCAAAAAAFLAEYAMAKGSLDNISVIVVKL
ncbi:Protein phosphatase 2C 51 [Linum grandiflorum]